MRTIKNNLNYILGALLGAISGYIYWKFVGCSSGTCPITSSPIFSSIYGTLMGILIGSILKKKRKE